MTDFATPDLGDVIEAAIDSALLDVHTALPATVVEYDATTQTARLSLGVARVLDDDDGADVPEDLPELANVPVQWLRAGQFFLVMPLATGDTGMVIFQESSIDQWRARGGANVAPGDRRRHSLTGAVFVPGLQTTATPLADPGIDTDAAFGLEGGVQLRMRDGTAEVTTSGAATAADFVAMAQKVLGALNALENAYNAHGHTGVLSGMATSGPPAAPVALTTDVASTNLKADV